MTTNLTPYQLKRLNHELDKLERMSRLFSEDDKQVYQNILDKIRKLPDEHHIK
ncbi:hypothetical protein [Scytonema sp. NUACC26]|uniref:hypothetical protein n=1 Tax=Scytonema sp. NUACC26 TaxID=3140176 RepID=UPI0038B36991